MILFLPATVSRVKKVQIQPTSGGTVKVAKAHCD